MQAYTFKVVFHARDDFHAGQFSTIMYSALADAGLDGDVIAEFVYRGEDIGPDDQAKTDALIDNETAIQNAGVNTNPLPEGFPTL